MCTIGPSQCYFRKGLPITKFRIAVQNLGKDLCFLVSTKAVNECKIIVHCKEFEKLVEIIDDGDATNPPIAMVDGEKVCVKIVKLKKEGRYTIFRKGSASFDVEMEQIYGDGLIDKQKKTLVSGTNSVTIKSPMHGRILNLLTSDGAKVNANQTLLILEAMKMEHSIKSPVEGTVKIAESVKKLLTSGQMVSDGVHLFDIIPTASSE